MNEFHVAGDLNGMHVTDLHSQIVAAIDAWITKTGVEAEARMMIAALLCDVCAILQEVPEEMRAAIAEEAVHFIFANGGADSREVFAVCRKRHDADALANVAPQGSA